METMTSSSEAKAKESFKNECISKYGNELGVEFYGSAIKGNLLVANKIESKNILYFDLCKVRPGFKFEHLVIEVIELYEYPKGNLIPAGLCHSLWIQIELRLPELDIGNSYTLSEILGIDYWTRLSETLRNFSDDCLMWLIDEQSIQLPLIRVQRNVEGIPLYQIK